MSCIRPVFSSPAAPGWNGNRFGFDPGLAPHSHPQSTPRRRQALARWPEYYTYGINQTSKRCLPLHSCTLMSHVIRRGLHGDVLDLPLDQVLARLADRAGAPPPPTPGSPADPTYRAAARTPCPSPWPHRSPRHARSLRSAVVAKVAALQCLY